jgi:superfamily II DNA or RNA helicase
MLFLMSQILAPPTSNHNRIAPQVSRSPIALNPPKKQPRDYQRKALRQLDYVLDRYADSLLWGATGTGKTLTQCSLAIGHALRGEQVAIIMAIRALPGQFLATLSDLGWPIEHVGLVGEGKADRPDAPIVLVMAGTLANRPHLLDRLNPALVIADEAHELYFDRFIGGLRGDHWSCARWVWASATPWRLNPREAFTRIQADAVVRLVGALRQIIGDGHLVPLRLYAEGGCADAADFELTKADGLRPADAAKLKTPEFLAKSAKILHDHGGDRYRAAALCTDIEQAELFSGTWAKLYPDKPAVVIHSKVAQGEWETRMSAWKSGEAWLMLSVGQVLTGFDWPPVDTLLWLRPTSSKCLWIQGCGRALRTSEETGKADALIIDAVGNWQRVGHPLRVADTPPQLKPSEKKTGEVPEKVCPDCGEIVSNFAAICPSCGYEFTTDQMALDGGEDAPFGEVPDPVLAKAVANVRANLKAAFTRWKNSGGKGNRDKYINELAEHFATEFISGSLYRWLLGAVFRGDRSQAAQCEFLRYLHSTNPIAPPGWIGHHFALEFGFRLHKYDEISGHQLLGVPPSATPEQIEDAYQWAVRGEYSEETNKLLRWAFDRAMEVARGAER